MEVSMTDKYKIYVPEEMKARLINDAELFDFTKKDETINLNAFLKTLLINYFDQYRETKTQLLDTILSDLSAFSSISNEDANAIADKIINTYLYHREFKPGRNAAITLTVSGTSLEVMHAIENNMLTRVSLSQYINDLLSSYLSLSRKDREKIIFQDTFDKLHSAIGKNSIITFSLISKPEFVFTIQPYLIAASKEEQFNYLLGMDNDSGLLRTFRISRIRSLYISSNKFTPDESIKCQLQEIAIRSPQAASKSVEAKVYLTNRGMKNFHVITKNRPDILQKDGNIWYFNWPKKQLENYFKRFGKDALILSPEESHQAMRSFYKKAFDVYRKSIKDD